MYLMNGGTLNVEVPSQYSTVAAGFLWELGISLLQHASDGPLLRRYRCGAGSDPHFGGHFEYGRPEKGHGWRPMNHAELVREMAERVTRNIPRGDDPRSWRYH